MFQTISVLKPCVWSGPYSHIPNQTDFMCLAWFSCCTCTIIPILFNVVKTWPVLSRLPVQLTELGTKFQLCHDMFTNLFNVVKTWPVLSCLPVQLTELGTKCHLCHDMFTNLFYVVKMWPVLSRLPIQLTELGTKCHFCHDMFTNLHYLKLAVCTYKKISINIDWV